MNRLAVSWLDTALVLDRENRELRAILTALLLAIAWNRDLLNYACARIDERWPGDRESDTIGAGRPRTSRPLHPSAQRRRRASACDDGGWM